jgi:hypothetical protein
MPAGGCHAACGAVRATRQAPARRRTALQRPAGCRALYSLHHAASLHPATSRSGCCSDHHVAPHRSRRHCRATNAVPRPCSDCCHDAVKTAMLHCLRCALMCLLIHRLCGRHRCVRPSARLPVPSRQSHVAIHWIACDHGWCRGHHGRHECVHRRHGRLGSWRRRRGRRRGRAAANGARCRSAHRCGRRRRPDFASRVDAMRHALSQFATVCLLVC